MHDRSAERAAGFVDIGTHGAAVEWDTLVFDVRLEPIVRHAEHELLHQDVGHHRRVHSPRGNNVLGNGTPSTVGPSLPGTSYLATRLTNTEKPPRRNNTPDAGHSTA